MYLIFDSVNKLDGSPKKKNLVQFRVIITWQNYFLKPYTVFTVKDFHIYDISILISVHANSIDSIYVDLGGLVV